MRSTLNPIDITTTEPLRQKLSYWATLLLLFPLTASLTATVMLLVEADVYEIHDDVHLSIPGSHIGGHSVVLAISWWGMGLVSLGLLILTVGSLLHAENRSYAMIYRWIRHK